MTDKRALKYIEELRTDFESVMDVYISKMTNDDDLDGPEMANVLLSVLGTLLMRVCYSCDMPEEVMHEVITQLYDKTNEHLNSGVTAEVTHG